MKIFVFFVTLLMARNSIAFGLGDYLPIQRMIVPQVGMYPTIDSDSSFFIKTGMLFSASDVQRGKIVTFRKEVKDKNYVFVWRVIGMPGDSVITDKTDVFLNGYPLKRDRDNSIPSQKIYYEYIDNISYRVALNGNSERVKRIEVLVPEGHVFVLGDNRNNAMDSRYLGLIPISSIFGVKIP
jgi:signal peptidase I